MKVNEITPAYSGKLLRCTYFKGKYYNGRYYETNIANCAHDLIQDNKIPDDSVIKSYIRSNNMTSSVESVDEIVPTPFMYIPNVLKKITAGIATRMIIGETSMEENLCKIKLCIKDILLEKANWEFDNLLKDLNHTLDVLKKQAKYST